MGGTGNTCDLLACAAGRRRAGSGGLAAGGLVERVPLLAAPTRAARPALGRGLVDVDGQAGAALGVVGDQGPAGHVDDAGLLAGDGVVGAPVQAADGVEVVGDLAVGLAGPVQVVQEGVGDLIEGLPQAAAPGGDGPAERGAPVVLDGLEPGDDASGAAQVEG